MVAAYADGVCATPHTTRCSLAGTSARRQGVAVNPLTTYAAQLQLVPGWAKNPCAPGNQRERSHLHWQTQHQQPIKHRKQRCILQHVDVGRRDCDGQRKQPLSTGPAGPVPPQARCAQKRKDAAEQYCFARPGNVGRNDPHLGVCRDKVDNSTDEEPQEDEPDSPRLATGGGAGWEYFWANAVSGDDGNLETGGHACAFHGAARDTGEWCGGVVACSVARIVGFALKPGGRRVYGRHSH